MDIDGEGDIGTELINLNTLKITIDNYKLYNLNTYYLAIELVYKKQWGEIDGMSSKSKPYNYVIIFPKSALFLYGGSISYEYGLAITKYSNSQFLAGWWPENLGKMINEKK